MALLESDFQFTGPLGNLSAYRMRGVDKIVVRRKGGASKKRIKNDREFARTRELNSEFAGRAKGVKHIMRAMYELKPVADHNFYGKLNALLKLVQDRDDEFSSGERSIRLSKHGGLLQGFSLNRYTSLESLVRTPLICKISRDTRSAKVEIPELIPGVNFFPPQKHPLFSVMAVLSVAPDLFFTKKGFKPTRPEYEGNLHHTVTTPWLPAMTGSPAATLELKLESTLPDDAWALLLSIAVCFGVPYDAQTVIQTKHAGSARILAVEGLMG